MFAVSSQALLAMPPDCPLIQSMRHAVVLFLGGFVVFASLTGVGVGAEPRASQAGRPTPARMAIPAPAKSVATVAAHADYQIYVRGLRIGRLETGFELQPAQYRVEIAFRTFGLVGWLWRGHQLGIAEGRLDRSRTEPLRFVGEGVWRGTPRRILIDYVGGQPVLRELEPPDDGEREPVPPALQANTIDTLSAMVLLIRHIAETGNCHTETTIFDGRRAVRLTARTVGEEALEPTRRSTFHGPALRCDFDGQLLAGFRRDDTQADRGKTRRGTAWFASIVPGAPLLPVQITFETTWLGDATLYLVGSGPGASRSPEER